MKKTIFLQVITFVAVRVWVVMLLSCLTLVQVQADEEDPDNILDGTISTWIEFATDYVFRGESETNDGEIPSLKAAVTWSHNSGAYVGFYSANNLFPTFCRGRNDPRSNCTAEGEEETNTRINAIVGPYLGWSGAVLNTGFSLNSMVFAYIYPDDSASNYVEMFNTVTLPSWKNFTLKLEYSPTLNEWFGVENLYSHYLGIHPSISLPMDLTLSGTYGFQMFAGSAGKANAEGYDPDWNHWSVAISKPLSGWNFNLSYHNTDIKIGQNAGYYDGPNNKIVDDRIVFAVSRSF